MCTKIRCQWNYYSSAVQKSIPFSRIYESVQRLTLETFAGDPVHGVYSASVQHTMYLIAKAVLAK